MARKLTLTDMKCSDFSALCPGDVIRVQRVRGSSGSTHKFCNRLEVQDQGKVVLVDAWQGTPHQQAPLEFQSIFDYLNQLLESDRLGTFFAVTLNEFGVDPNYPTPEGITTPHTSYQSNSY